MAYTTIDKPSDYFNTVLYSGNGNTDHAITGVGFQPDFFWGKKRSATGSNFLVNSISGVGKHLISDSTDAETAFAEGVKSFDSDGVTIGTGADINENSQTFVSWNWSAGGSASSNSNGSITSSVSANTTAGFSIVSYTATNANATVGHGLSSALDMLLVKNRDSAKDWRMWFKGFSGTERLEFNNTEAKATTNTSWNGTVPSSSLFSLGNDSNTNNSTDDYIAYCFHSVKGYSKFGTYKGSNSTNGPFIHTGFKPAWLMVKRIDSEDTATNMNGSHWVIIDNKRDPINDSGTAAALIANKSDAEDTTNLTDVEFVSNGFKFRGGADAVNDTGTYIYMSFAASPFVTSKGVPTTAR